MGIYYICSPFNENFLIKKFVKRNALRFYEQHRQRHSKQVVTFLRANNNTPLNRDNKGVYGSVDSSTTASDSIRSFYPYCVLLRNKAIFLRKSRYDEVYTRLIISIFARKMPISPLNEFSCNTNTHYTLSQV